MAQRPPYDLAEEHPASIRVLHDLVSANADAEIETIRQLGWRGADIWNAYDGWSGRNAQKLIDGLRTQDAAMLAVVVDRRGK
jgi:hypothetical protein